jgi:hypothetical protein
LRGEAIRALGVPDNLTIFQAMLPPPILERELVDVWLKMPIYARSLSRLRVARVTPVPMSEAGLLVG